MSIPRDHHYLPKWFLNRWRGPDGKVVRFTRPQGSEGPLVCERKVPKAIAYLPDLYHLPDIPDPRESQTLELHFFQQIDDRAAKAIDKLDRGERGTLVDRVALAQFMVSLLHRTPTRLKAIQERLAEDTEGAPYEGLKGAAFEAKVKATANRLLANLVESPKGARILGKLDIHVLRLQSAGASFLTSDRPLSVSTQLVAPGAFLIMPYSPTSMLMLCNDREIVRSFATQGDKRLAAGINQAIVEQAHEIVVASNTKAMAMIDRLFLRPQPGSIFDEVGLIRRAAPYNDLRPKIRTFSSARKREMLYLGR
ncbi:DUF4238 domain-containing protein [Citromicrobium bathyomarinum]